MVSTFYNGQILTADDLNDLLSPPVAMLRRAATQSMADDTNVQISWDTELRDTHNGWASSPNPTRYTVPTGWGGVWGWTALGSWAANSTNRRSIQILVNGTGVNGTQIILAGSSFGGGTASLFAGGELDLTAGQYVELQLWQNSTSSLNTSTGNTQPALNLWWIRP